MVHQSPAVDLPEVERRREAGWLPVDMRIGKELVVIRNIDAYKMQSCNRISHPGRFASDR
jgi:hypothetical protein